MTKKNSKSENALKTIGEVSVLINVPTHVIRFWEQNFSILNPVKYNNRRYYSLKNVEVIREIKDLLYNKKLSIKDAKSFIKKSKDCFHNNKLEETLQNLINARKKLVALLD